MMGLRHLRKLPALLALLGVGVCLTACAAAFVENKEVSGDEREQIARDTAPYLQKGTGSISGVVRIDTAQGGFTASTGTQVLLTPATAVASARFQEYVIEKNELPTQRKAEIMLLARTDSSGRFRFEKLAAGQYLLASAVAWSPTGDPGAARSEVTYARVTLAAGEQASVTVTRAIAP